MDGWLAQNIQRRRKLAQADADTFVDDLGRNASGPSTKIGLSQPKFAALLHVDVGMLRNWEQGRRGPTGPAKALLTAIERDPGPEERAEGLGGVTRRIHPPRP